MLLANEDPFARNAACDHIGFCPTIPHSGAVFKILYDLSVGALVTLLFYLLVVRLPDYQRRRRLKKGLERHYRLFRLDCIQILLLVADGTFKAGFPETLLRQDQFKEYFSQKTSSDRNRWNDFENNLDQTYLRELLTLTEMFRDELSFVLNNTDIPKDKPFEFLKRLSASIYAMKDTKLGYDETKRFSQFLWSVLAGWDMITGYRKEDIVEKMIKAI